MSTFPFIGPIAGENNPDIEPSWFGPSSFPITAITLGSTTLVTLSAIFGVDPNYVIGQQVRFVIPREFGIRKLNERSALVLSIPSTYVVEVNINTSLDYDPFIPSPPHSTTPPSMAAIGDINTGIITPVGRDTLTTYIPGSFINISPGIGVIT